MDWILQITDAVREHLCVEGTGCPLPSTQAWRDAGKRWDKVNVSGYISTLQGVSINGASSMYHSHKKERQVADVFP